MKRRPRRVGAGNDKLKHPFRISTTQHWTPDFSPGPVELVTVDVRAATTAAAGEKSGGSGGRCLIADGEASPAMLGVLEFVDEGNRVVLERNRLLPCAAAIKSSLPRRNLPGALAGLKESSRAKVGPMFHGRRHLRKAAGTQFHGGHRTASTTTRKDPTSRHDPVTPIRGTCIRRGSHARRTNKMPVEKG